MELLGEAYRGHHSDSSEDTDSDLGSGDSMGEQDDDHILLNNISDKDNVKPYQPGTSDEDEYVNPDEGTFVDRGSHRACYTSLRSCCEFLSKLCQEGAQIDVVRSAIKASGSVIDLARLLHLHALSFPLLQVLFVFEDQVFLFVRLWIAAP